MSGWAERAGNLVHALRRRPDDDARMRWSRERLMAYQRARVRDLVAHASARSPFYRALYGGTIDGDVELGELPIVTKDAMMAGFDRFVTDPRLRLEALRTHVETVRGDELYLGEHRVMSSSGSSGAKATFVYDRAAWRDGMLPASLRLTRMLGLSPRLPRPRLVTIAAGDGKHMTYRGGASMDVGMFWTRRISAGLALPDLVAAVQTSRPDYIVGYPSILALLADEQRAGRLRVFPTAIATSSEVRTQAMTASMRDAWGIEPHDCLGMTEAGIVAVDCREHAGLHVFEDLTILEVVDAHGRPVPPRTVGAKVLVTNLTNFVQPIIRYEVSDLVAIDPAPCRCGINLARIVALDGRSDDILDLPGPDGRARIHPIVLRGLLGARPEVLQYQVVQRGARLDVDVVLASGLAGETTKITTQLARRLTASLRDHGADVVVEVRAVPSMVREPGASKLKLVRAG